MCGRVFGIAAFLAILSLRSVWNSLVMCFVLVIWLCLYVIVVLGFGVGFCCGA